MVIVTKMHSIVGTQTATSLLLRQPSVERTSTVLPAVAAAPKILSFGRDFDHNTIENINSVNNHGQKLGSKSRGSSKWLTNGLKKNYSRRARSLFERENFAFFAPSWKTLTDPTPPSPLDN